MKKLTGFLLASLLWVFLTGCAGMQTAAYGPPGSNQYDYGYLNNCLLMNQEGCHTWFPGGP